MAEKEKTQEERLAEATAHIKDSLDDNFFLANPGSYLEDMLYFQVRSLGLNRQFYLLYVLSFLRSESIRENHQVFSDWLKKEDTRREVTEERKAQIDLIAVGWEIVKQENGIKD